MIGVGENDRSAQLFERFLRQPFDRGRRAHGHERRRLDLTVRCAELAPPRGRPRILLLYFKRKPPPASVSGENPSPPNAAHHVNGPHTKRNSEGLAALKLLRICRGKADG